MLTAEGLDRRLQLRRQVWLLRLRRLPPLHWTRVPLLWESDPADYVFASSSGASLCVHEMLVVLQEVEEDSQSWALRVQLEFGDFGFVVC